MFFFWFDLFLEAKGRNPWKKISLVFWDIISKLIDLYYETYSE